MRRSLTIAAFLAAAAQQTVASPDSCCCSALAQHKDLEGKVLFPDSEAYDARLNTYYSANAAQSPWCMVMPTKTSEVSTIAKVISAHECPFGMRSGGHSAFKGANGVHDGVTIDFSYMNQTTYDKKTGIASMQPGQDYGQAYTALNESGVVIVGGRADVVGLGGFTSGGGYSFHSAAHGFACDNIVNYEFVLANGTIVNANAHENADLWHAQKGSSGNLGFITRIDMPVIDNNILWGGFVGYDLSKQQEVFEAYYNFAENQAEDEASQSLIGMYFNSTATPHVTMNTILTNVDNKPNQPIFDEYLQIENISSGISTGAFADMVNQFTGPTPLGLYANWMAGMTKNDVPFMNYLVKKLRHYGQEMISAAPSGAEFTILIEFQPVTQSILSHSHKLGGNVLGLEPVVADGPANMWLVALTCDTKETQDKIEHLQLEFRDDLNRYATRKGINSDWDYLNYAFRDQDPIAKYGSRNIGLIRDAARKYDPEGVFQKLRHSGFKIPAADDEAA